MSNTYTLPKQNFMFALGQLHKFLALADALWGLEVALSAETFTHGKNEWAQMVIRDTHENVRAELARLVERNGFARGLDDINARHERGIMSEADYYGTLGIILRRLVAKGN